MFLFRASQVAPVVKNSPNWERSMSRVYIVTLINLYAEFIMWNARLHEAQAGVKTAGRNSNNFRHTDYAILMAENEEELNSLLMKLKEKREKLALDSTFKKQRTWHPLPSLHGKHMGKQWRQWQTLFSWAPKSLQMVTCSHEIKRCLLLEGKAIMNLDSKLKSRSITLQTKVKGPCS